MHEISLMQQVIEMAQGYAAQHQAQTIHRIRLRVGAGAGVVPEALEFAFEAVTHQTLAAGAALEIETVPIRCYCPACDAEFEPDDVIYLCPGCQRLSTDLRQGRDLELASLEMS